MASKSFSIDRPTIAEPDAQTPSSTTTTTSSSFASAAAVATMGYDPTEYQRPHPDDVAGATAPLRRSHLFRDVVKFANLIVRLASQRECHLLLPVLLAIVLACHFGSTEMNVHLGQNLCFIIPMKTVVKPQKFPISKIAKGFGRSSSARMMFRTDC